MELTNWIMPHILRSKQQSDNFGPHKAILNLQTQKFE